MSGFPVGLILITDTKWLVDQQGHPLRMMRIVFWKAKQPFKPETLVLLLCY